MIFDVITIFPDFFRSVLDQGLLKRAIAGEQATVRLHDLRDFTDDRHRTVDDRPFGGGPGMVFKPEPLFRAVEALQQESGGERLPVILLSPQGRLLRQPVVEELAHQPRVALICGRYEGVDERVTEHVATDEISIGDYVLSGGELAAAVIMEATTRLLPGVLGNEDSVEWESFASAPESDPTHRGSSKIPGRDRRGLLDFPHYTRPADFRGWCVPEVLLSGNHRKIERWRHQQALLKTWRKRPELLADIPLSAEDAAILAEAKQETAERF